MVQALPFFCWVPDVGDEFSLKGSSHKAFRFGSSA